MNQAKIRRHLDKLAEIDADLRRGLELVQYPQPRIRSEGFETLLATIVSQQISTEAAAAIMRRVRDLLPRMQAGEVLRLPSTALREAGLSMRKAEYVEGLARRPQGAVALTKRLLYDLDDLSFDDGIERGAQVNVEARMSDECRSGVRRFLERSSR